MANWAVWRKWATRESRSIIAKEILKYLLLTICTLLLGWFFGVVSGLLHLEVPLTQETALKRLAELVASDPYAWTVGLIRRDPVHVVVGLIFGTFVAITFVLLRRASRRIHGQAQLLKDSATYRALVSEAGLGGRWPHARADGTGAPWKDLCAEILRPDNHHLYILGANGIDTFGGPHSPLYGTLQQFSRTIRVILVKPDSQEVIGRSEALNQDPAIYRAAIEVSVRRLRDLRRQQHAIEGRFYDGQPNWKLIVTSRTVWMQYYTPGGAHVDQTPCWRFDLTATDGGLYHYFFMEFDRIWRRCEPAVMDLH
jgi:hypothetical protein